MAYQALIIDDNSVCAAVLSGLLRKCGIIAEMEESAAAAFKREDLTSFDLIFADYLMPEFNGVETARKIREEAEKKQKKIPIILYTANIDEVQEKEKREVSAILQKPVKQKELEDVLRSCISWENISMQETASAQEEKEKLQISGLSCTYAIELSGDIATYKKILKEYYKTIDGRIHMLRVHAQNYEVEAFKIEVHGLKSASRLIGALEFAKFCAKVEDECGSYDDETLLGAAEQLISKYRRFHELLRPYVDIQISKKSKPRAKEEQLVQWFGKVKNALEDFDFDKAENILDEIQEYQLSDFFDDLVKKLQEKMNVIDYAGGIAIIDTALGHILNPSDI